MPSGPALPIVIPSPTPNTVYRNTAAFSLSVQHQACANYPGTRFPFRHDSAYSPLPPRSAVFALCLYLCSTLCPSKFCFPILTNAYRRTLSILATSQPPSTVLVSLHSPVFFRVASINSRPARPVHLK